MTNNPAVLSERLRDNGGEASATCNLFLSTYIATRYTLTLLTAPSSMPEESLTGRTCPFQPECKMIGLAENSVYTFTASSEPATCNRCSLSG